MKYIIQIEPEAKLDIQDAITWYNTKQKGLGRKLYVELKEFLSSLEHNPLFEIKYDNVRCLPLKRFPYTLHYTVNLADKIVVVRAVYHAARNPNIWKKRL